MYRIAVIASALGLLVAVGATTAVAAPEGGLTTVAAAPCPPKKSTIGGRPAFVFCGPAAATINAVGRTFRIKGGSCTKQLGSRFAQIGTIGGPTRDGLQTSSLFYVLFDSANASKGAILYWIVDAKRYRAAKSPRIAQAGNRITISGTLDRGVGATGSGPFSGTVTCG